jgi:FixJ family two-component response regulator
VLDSAEVHGKQQPGFACVVGSMQIKMARRGGEKQAFADGKILAVEGNAEIAVILGISPRTVDKHVEHIYERFGVESRGALTVRLLRPSV